MSSEEKQPCPHWDDHEFREVYYGYKCIHCDLFYAFGCAPWEELQDGDVADGRRFRPTSAGE
jgi:hypothetical protein